VGIVPVHTVPHLLLLSIRRSILIDISLLEGMSTLTNTTINEQAYAYSCEFEYEL
jgi:hypothetical protein